MKFRTTSVSALLLLGTTLLTGCGGSGDSNSAPSTQSFLDVTIRSNCETRPEYVWLDDKCRIADNPFVDNLNAIEKLPSQDRANLVAYLVSTEKFQSFDNILPGFTGSTNTDEPNNDSWIDNRLLADKLNQELLVEVGAQQVLLDQLVTASTSQTWVQSESTTVEINGQSTSKSAEFLLDDGTLTITVMGEVIYSFTPIEALSLSAHLGMNSTTGFTNHPDQSRPLYLEDTKDFAVFIQPNLQTLIQETLAPTDASIALVKDALSLSQRFTDENISITRGTMPAGFKVTLDNGEGYIQGFGQAGGTSNNNIDTYLIAPRTLFEDSIDTDIVGTMDFQIWLKPNQKENLGFTANTILSANGTLDYQADIQENDASELSISFSQLLATTRATLDTHYNIDDVDILENITNVFVDDYYEKSEALRNSAYLSELSPAYQDGFPQAYDIVPVYNRLVGTENFATHIMENDRAFPYFLTRAMPNYSVITSEETTTPYRYYDFVVGRFIANTLAYELSRDDADFKEILDRWTLVSNNLGNTYAEFYNSILDPIELILDELPNDSVEHYYEAVSELAATFGYRHIPLANSSLITTINSATNAATAPYEEPVVDNLEDLRSLVTWNGLGRFWSINEEANEKLETVPQLLTEELKATYQTHDDVSVLFDLPVYAYNYIFLEPETAQSQVEAKTVVLNRAVANTNAPHSDIVILNNHNIGRWNMISRGYHENWNEHVYADVLQILRYMPRSTFTGDLQCTEGSMAEKYNCVRMTSLMALDRFTVGDTGYLENGDGDKPFITKANIIEGWIAKHAEIISLNSLDAFNWENRQINSIREGHWLSCDNTEINRRIDRTDELLDAALDILRVNPNPLSFTEEGEQYNEYLDEYKDLMEACI